MHYARALINEPDEIIVELEIMHLALYANLLDALCPGINKRTGRNHSRAGDNASRTVCKFTLVHFETGNSSDALYVPYWLLSRSMSLVLARSGSMSLVLARSEVELRELNIKALQTGKPGQTNYDLTARRP
ncbi:hypothetical protein QE152_g37613 [Popillia japonica]|uniref:Uncharacterized protein n=1 Tax=Popillia japonica TaxID=7064 RepID=A0AAW1I9C6_POPJA